MARISIEGGRELDRALKKLPRALARKIIRQSLREAARPIVEEAKSRAPVLTGQMRDSLRVRAGKRRKGQASMAVQTKDGDYAGDTFYAAFYEYGTSRQPARPFMRPAFDARVHEAVRIVSDALRRRITEAAKSK
jgi:HK97 gp10 family phage protein